MITMRNQTEWEQIQIVASAFKLPRLGLLVNGKAMPLA